MENKTSRPIAFVLASTNHGSMIVNRNDYKMMGDNGGAIGVGYQLLTTSSYDLDEINFVMLMLAERRAQFGDGVVALDLGANIGVCTVEWAKLMHGWGRVIAVEAQERIYYALAGNVAINNCFNAQAIFGAVGKEVGYINVPAPNYLIPGSFGSMEIRQSERNEFIGQEIDYAAERGVMTRLLTIDSLGLERLDFLKIDVEGMELEVLEGGRETIASCRPVMLVERLKVKELDLNEVFAAHGYKSYAFGYNLLAVHESDGINQKIVVS